MGTHVERANGPVVRPVGAPPFELVAIALVLKGVGEQWSVDPAPSPGIGDNVLGGVAVFGDTAWAVGTYKDGGPRNTLIMRHSES